MPLARSSATFAAVFANLFSLLSNKPGSYERAFVEEIREPKSPRNRKVERRLLACWVIILFKSYFILWLFSRYKIPINPLWVIAPTVVFACLITAVYFLRD